MKEEGKDEIKLRFSDASTVDYNFSSDDENMNEKCFTSTFSPMDAICLLDSIPEDIKLQYADLESRLNSVSKILDEEIAPVCIREERCLLASSVNLSAVCGSKLYRRRSTLKLSR
ncbi:hypothetical protein SteCoe_32409 [Stentor coeruleus]|uniref:Uncharacterized protein n=1 Tax=Stentor coeruleus TaxID=5963 RepID=A0A1R2AZ15_9CILI|nr:hypothetical protein SteCoe_32409 [Stentor coeruleus]